MAARSYKTLWLSERGARRLGAVAIPVGLVLMAVGAGAMLHHSFGWNPREPFMRNAPAVNRAMALMKAGDNESAQKILAEYLGTGECSAEGHLELSDRVRKLPDGSFDLGLTLFNLAEKYGARFGEEEQPGEGGKPAEIDPRRNAEIDCALIVVQAIAADRELAAELRARAAYLAGNLEFLRRKYESAVKQYDDALELVPGIAADAKGDGIGRDAAWNRAIALRRIEEKEKQNPPPPDPSSQPPPPEPKQDDSDQHQGDKGDKGDKSDQDRNKGDKGQDDKNKGDKDKDKDKDKNPGDPNQGDPKRDQGNGAKGDPQNGNKGDGSPEQIDEPPDAHAPPQSRMLDDLREAPSYQGESAKRDAARVRRGPAMEDK